MAIYALGDLEPSIDPTAYVHPLAVVIGNVELGPEASVWPYAVLRGDDGLIRIGARSNVQDSAVIHCTPRYPTIVGDGVTIGHQAHLEGCTVLDGSLIGVGSVVMHDARIGPNALVGANATVTGGTVVPAQAMALGTPARIREDALDPDHNQRNAEVYAQRGHHYRAEQRRID
ncbi:MAG: gamma carbonic anhydrase family protein [Acidimicrobiaceae bacterium]|nr:gamma carbonic anhydrase family protein [Acidimicrobiaceae bacterium]